MRGVYQATLAIRTLAERRNVFVTLVNYRILKNERDYVMLLSVGRLYQVTQERSLIALQLITLFEKTISTET